MNHHHCKAHKVTNTAVTDAIIRKIIEERAAMPKVKWVDEETSNAWRTQYFGSMFEADGGCMTDVKIRIMAARQWFEKMKHTWADKTSGFISTYGSDYTNPCWTQTVLDMGLTIDHAWWSPTHK